MRGPPVRPTGEIPGVLDKITESRRPRPTGSTEPPPKESGKKIMIDPPEHDDKNLFKRCRCINPATGRRGGRLTEPRWPCSLV
jgi:hypothetical protein